MNINIRVSDAFLSEVPKFVYRLGYYAPAAYCVTNCVLITADYAGIMIKKIKAAYEDYQGNADRANVLRSEGERRFIRVWPNTLKHTAYCCLTGLFYIGANIAQKTF